MKPLECCDDSEIFHELKHPEMEICNLLTSEEQDLSEYVCLIQTTN